MITWGINALNHDASIAVVKNGELIFWRRSAEYTGVRGDPHLAKDLIRDAIRAGGEKGPDRVAWYERPWLKKTRQFWAGQYRWAFDWNEIPTKYLGSLGLSYPRMRYYPHHLSHAAAGALTSAFEQGTVVVLDAMGEWESSTIWSFEGTRFRKLWSRSYPTSLGLFYSAFTHLIGLTPVAEEHILQQMSSRGDPDRYFDDVYRYWSADWRLRENLHRGVRTWPHEIKTEQDRCDIAAGVQRMFELQASLIMDRACQLADSRNLVYMGGCAMNSQFNQKLDHWWERVWTPPIPGDSSSAIGAALLDQNVRAEWPCKT